jgi:hypothetical protein
MRLSFVQEVLLAAAAVLALLLLVEVWLVMPDPSLTGRPVVATSLQSTAPSMEALPIFTLPPRDSMRAFIEHPLFERTRRAAGEPYATKELCCVDRLR